RPRPRDWTGGAAGLPPAATRRDQRRAGRRPATPLLFAPRLAEGPNEAWWLEHGGGGGGVRAAGGRRSVVRARAAFAAEPPRAGRARGAARRHARGRRH